MLPQKLQNLDEELSEEDIRSKLIMKITRFLQEASLLNQKQGNISLDYQLINTQASFLYKIRLHERSKQINQREMVSNIFTARIGKFYVTMLFFFVINNYV